MLLILPTLWWLVFFAVLGLCIGSFANVLIHRLPLNQPLRTPRWSACPHCHWRIPWKDNVPVLSFLILRGRCRECRHPISVRYPVVELAMALIFVLLVGTLLLSNDRAGLSPLGVDPTARLIDDWPILLAHLALFTCLFAMSAIDLEFYWVDIRFTNFVTVLGFAVHALWTPKHSLEGWPRPEDGLMVGSFAALVGLGASWLVLSWAPWDPPEESVGETTSLDGAQPMESPYQSRQTSSVLPVWIFLLILVITGAGLLWHARTESSTVRSEGSSWIDFYSIPALAALFGLILAMSRVSRESDADIAEVIEEESAGARSAALWELLFLLPAILAAIWAMMVYYYDVDLQASVHRALRLRLDLPQVGLGDWMPVYGLGTAAAGYVAGGALGWAVRVFFTLVFGKEAFGTGDIHLMAAAGCVAGWPVAALGFFLACFLAMIGWVAALPFKRTRAVPLGPWLSIAFLILIVFHDPLMNSSVIQSLVDLWRLLTPRLFP